MKTDLFETTTLAAGLTTPGSPAELIMMAPQRAETKDTQMTEAMKVSRRQRTTLSRIEERILETDYLVPALASFDGKFAAYKEGMDDHVVAQLASEGMNRPVSFSNVSAVRKDFYGQIRPRVVYMQEHGKQSANDFQKDLNRTRSEVRKLGQRVDALQAMVVRMAKELGIET